MDTQGRMRPSSAASSVISVDGMRMRGVRRYRTLSANALTLKARELKHDPWMRTTEKPPGMKSLAELNAETEDEEELRRTLFLPPKDMSIPEKKDHMEKQVLYRCRRDPTTGYSEVEFTGETGIPRHQYKPRLIIVEMGKSKLPMYVCQGYFSQKKEVEEKAATARMMRPQSGRR